MSTGGGTTSVALDSHTSAPLDAASAVERDGLVERFGVEGERDVGVVVRAVVLVVAARLASRRRRVFRGGNPHPVLPRGSVRARHESEGVQHRQRLLGEVAVEPPLRQQERVVGGDRAGASSIHEYELARLLHRRRAHRASSGRQRRLEVRDVALRRRALRRRARGGRAERSESLGRSRFVHVRRRFDFDFFLLVGARRRLREPRTEPPTAPPEKNLRSRPPRCRARTPRCSSSVSRRD